MDFELQIELDLLKTENFEHVMTYLTESAKRVRGKESQIKLSKVSAQASSAAKSTTIVNSKDNLQSIRSSRTIKLGLILPLYEILAVKTLVLQSKKTEYAGQMRVNDATEKAKVINFDTYFIP